MNYRNPTNPYAAQSRYSEYERDSEPYESEQYFDDYYRGLNRDRDDYYGRPPRFSRNMRHRPTTRRQDDFYPESHYGTRGSARRRPDEERSDYSRNEGYRPNRDNYYGNNDYDRDSSRRRDKYYGQAPKDFKRSDDRIKEEVCDSLMRVGHVDKSDISVSVDDGEVKLSGRVSNRSEKREIEDQCENIMGVKDIQNNLRVESEYKASENESSKNRSEASGDTPRKRIASVKSR